jgi:putative nucleotidyltransferase with HDIG domain
MSDTKELKAITKDLSVLYVEDDVALRSSVTLYLKKFFSKVTVASNGSQGLQSYQEHPYDIIITDIEMPYMNGIEMIKEIKRITSDQEVIIISAYSQSSYFLDAIRLGVNDYIIKPINHIQMNHVLYKTATKLVRFRENSEYKEQLEAMVEKRTQEVLSLEADKIQNFEKTLLAFIELIEDRDTYTAGHSQRVAHYSKLIAQEMQCSEQECELIYQAGILHDIGKIATPDTVLLKPGKLNELEYALIQEHVKVGYELLSKVPMYKEAADIIVHHHERYDGKGYPQGLKGSEIPLLSNIMIVADAFDAMTTNRIYKGRKDNATAIKELKELSGIQFHPMILESAVKVLSGITIHESISQLPTSKIEQERFAYFYRDQVTDAFNTEYLEYILHRNRYEKEYVSINALYLHNFSHYNRTFGWSEGDKLLKLFAAYLCKQFPKTLVFRFHGDDFLVISKTYIEIDMNQFEKLDILDTGRISVSKLSIDMQKNVIGDLKDIEMLIAG